MNREIVELVVRLDAMNSQDKKVKAIEAYVNKEIQKAFFKARKEVLGSFTGKK